MTDDLTEDMKGRLERLGERGSEHADAFERLREARERRDRRRARSALAVGLSIVVVGALVAVNTLRDDGTAPVPRDDDPVVEAWQVPEAPYLWPENWARLDDRETLTNVQAAADEGTTGIGWRLDPEQVVRRFVGSVLAWERPTIRPTDLAGAYTVTQECPETDPCSAMDVVVAQPLVTGEDGVWSVVSATSPDLGIPLGVRLDALAPGSAIDLDLSLPEWRSAHAGLIASNGCREVSEFALALENGTSSLEVPIAEPGDPSCGETGAGYLFVYAMDDTTVPTGDPLLEAAAIEYPWLTMIPVQVQMSAAPDDQVPARVAVIECSRPGVDGTRVLTPLVAAQADGVHVEVRNTSDVDLGISFATRGDNADVGTTELVLDSPPGTEEALCTGMDTDPRDTVPFEVVDPQGHWVSTGLDGEMCRSTNIDYGEVPAGNADPIDAARDHLGDQVLEGDELVLAGYPEAAVEKVLVLRRDGVPIMSVEMFEGTEGWFVHTVTSCG